ncbi:MAG: GNAT family N-acetyltransferase [Gammaproteobacteria bacterium]|jgi:putative acetyltransferase
MPEADIEQLDPDDPEVRRVIDIADEFYSERYPEESNHLEPVEALKHPDILFVGCRVEGRLAASGAVKIMTDDDTYAEIKRLFVLDEYRGMGLSRRIMDYLESRMRAQGIELFRLETGIYQPEAIALYRRLGYREREPFGAYREDPLSVFMEKRVDAKSGRNTA